MHATVNRGMQVGHTWAKEDLKQVFDEQYRRNYPGTKPKQDVDAAFNLRKKSRKSMQRLEINLHQWVDTQKNSILAGKQIEVIDEAMKKASPAENAKLQVLRSRARKNLAEGPPVVTYYQGRGKRVVAAQMPAETYIRMTTAAGQVDNENQGFLRGAERAGHTEVIAFDGDDCGWTSHDDPDKADGASVNLTFAKKYPKAHPHCQRTFEIINKTSKEMAKDRARARKLAQKAIKAEARALKLQQAKKAVRISAKAVSIGVKIYRSDTVRLLARNIMSERYHLPVPLREFANKFARYETQEKIVASTASMAEGKEVTTNEVRTRILSWADQLLGEPDQVHKVPVAMQNVLSIPPESTTRRIQESAWSYGDWIAKDRGATIGPLDNAVDSHIWAAARHELHAPEPVMAQYFHLADPRGINVGGATRQTINVLKAAITKDTDALTESIVRDLATNIDPFPWAKASFGPFRVSLGMSTEGRRNLAEKLFKQIRDTNRWNAADRQLADEMGITLIKNVTLNDVKKALLPRITMNPGGLFSFTIASENGIIKPVFRVLPQWAVTKYFGYEAQLASGAIGRIKQAVDEGANFGDILTSLPDELVSTINMNRHGPFNANLKFWGSKFNGYSILAKPDGDWIRFANRWRRYERNAAGEIVRIDNHWSEVAVMPTGWANLTFSNKNGLVDVVGRLHAFSGSLVHVAREMRWDYASLKKFVADAKERVGYDIKALRLDELKNIRSWEDLKKYVGGFGDQATSRVEQAVAPTIPVGNRNVSPLLEHQASPALSKEIDTFNNTWDQQFPHSRRPNFDIAGRDEQRAEIEYRDGTIFIREDAATNWTALKKIALRNESVGFSPTGTGTTQGLLWHEAGHDLFNRMGPRGLHQLAQDISNSEDVPLYIRERFTQFVPGLKADSVEKFQRIFFGTPGRPLKIDPPTKAWIRNNVSGYATKNIGEMIGEAFNEYMTSRHPRPFAELVGRILTTYGGDLNG